MQYSFIKRYKATFLTITVLKKYAFSYCKQSEIISGLIKTLILTILLY